MAAAKGAVTEFPVFANFEEKKRKSNLLMSFLVKKEKKNVFLLLSADSRYFRIYAGS